MHSLTGLSPPVKNLLTGPRRYLFCGSFYVFSVLCLLCLCARLFICALWTPAGIGLTSWLSFVVSNCEFVTFPLVSWVRCGTILSYQGLRCCRKVDTMKPSLVKMVWYLIVSIPDLCTLTYLILNFSSG